MSPGLKPGDAKPRQPGFAVFSPHSAVALPADLGGTETVGGTEDAPRAVAAGGQQGQAIAAIQLELEVHGRPLDRFASVISSGRVAGWPPKLPARSFRRRPRVPCVGFVARSRVACGALSFGHLALPRRKARGRVFFLWVEERVPVRAIRRTKEGTTTSQWHAETSESP